MVEVVLYEPEIPPNTGNVIRLCANTGVALHLIHPLGFTLDAAKLRRAGLDYREMVTVTEHHDWDAFLASREPSVVWALTTKAQRSVFDASFDRDDVVLFGPETRGLPDEILAATPPDRQLRLPMQPGSRSLNLSNAVAVVVYEAWRQQQFIGAGGK